MEERCHVIQVYYFIFLANAAVAHYGFSAVYGCLPPLIADRGEGMQESHSTQALHLSLFSCHGGRKADDCAGEVKWGNCSISAERGAHGETR